MVKVKICGITNLDDALVATELGADALGFVFADSPRRIVLEQVQDIAAGLPPFVCKVGVFVDSGFEEIQRAISIGSLDLVQLHGSEDPDLCRLLAPRVVKSFRVKDESVLDLLSRYEVRAYLFDTYNKVLKGGTGQVFDWDIAKRATEKGRIILSGGLNPDNVMQAVCDVRPYAVDVSSGVESRPGKKDHQKLRSFIQAAKGA